MGSIVDAGSAFWQGLAHVCLVVSLLGMCAGGAAVFILGTPAPGDGGGGES